jgi:ATP-dependent exoDNAse (exonuclease V) beta subunit
MSDEIILPRDVDIRFPEFILFKASAGTGKTHALTLRFTQFLLSDRIKNNLPRQILAITFTRNAAKEMKSRILGWLKDCYFGQPETVDQILELVSIKKEALVDRAQEVLESLLDNYSDFQVMTIDSFMAEVFKASAIDLGLSPDFEITLDSTPVISYAFFKFLRKVRPRTPEGNMLLEITENLQILREGQAAFVWDPTTEIQERFTELYHQLEASNRQPVIQSLASVRKFTQSAEKKILKSVKKIKAVKSSSNLTWNESSAFFSRMNSDRITDWLDCSFKRCPVTRPLSEKDKRTYDRIEQEWLNLERKIKEYKELHARHFFQPHLQVYQDLLDLLAITKKERALVFLEDIHRKLADYLNTGIVPDVYFCLGDQIYHYLIDEFQDTSPLQWQNLEPLVDNALAQGGSLFIVGDTKQAIYGFREADYQIMLDLINGERGFGSAPVEIKNLEINRRSNKVILDFVSKIFPRGLKTLVAEDDSIRLMKEAAQKSGLDDFKCLTAEDKKKSKKREAPEQGYVEMEIMPAEKKESPGENDRFEDENTQDEDEQDQETRVKSKIQELVSELIERGYRFSDIAILAYRNETVARIAAWLNEKEIPFIPFSSLDIRNRQVIKELLAFLQFLDFPLDDLNLSVFLFGQLFQEKIKADKFPYDLNSLREFILDSREQPQTKGAPLYTVFRNKFPDLWDKYFESFFKTAGYFPLYELVSQAYRTFGLLDLFPDEQAALVKLLEVIKHFEGQGKSNLREFIRFSEAQADAQSIWTVDVPEEIPAVRIMTIHKAKGLGFPVVILLLYPEQFISPPFYLRKLSDHQEKNPPFEVLKLNKQLVSASPYLEEPYKDYRLKEAVNRLNTLYVALTRAREELYVIGASGSRKSYPFDLLEAIGFSLDQKYQSSPVKPTIASRPIAPLQGSFLKTLPTRASIPAPERTGLNYPEQKRGELIHSLLAEIEYFEDDLDSVLFGVSIKPLFKEFSASELEEAFQTLKKFLVQPGVAEFFKSAPGRTVLREKELVNLRGELFRADRLVIDPDRITVIDFKTGKAREPEIKENHLKQIKNYKSMLKEIYPERKINAFLMYIDLNSTEKVE